MERDEQIVLSATNLEMNEINRALLSTSDEEVNPKSRKGMPGEKKKKKNKKKEKAVYMSDGDEPTSP